MFANNILIALVVGIPMTFAMNYIGTISGAWLESSFIEIRVLRAFPIESIIWGILFCLFMISSYKYFFANNTEGPIFFVSLRKRFGVVTMIMLVVGMALLSTVLFIPSAFLFTMPMFLLIIIGFLAIPATMFFLPHPKWLSVSTLHGLYLLVLGTIYEYAAVTTGQWVFPGTYLKVFRILGASIPVEELIWWLLAPIAFVGLYKYYFEKDIEGEM